MNKNYRPWSFENQKAISVTINYINDTFYSNCAGNTVNGNGKRYKTIMNNRWKWTSWACKTTCSSRSMQPKWKFFSKILSRRSEIESTTELAGCDLSRLLSLNLIIEDTVLFKSSLQTLASLKDSDKDWRKLSPEF